MNQHLLRGMGVSLLIHGVVLCSVVYVGILLPDVAPPLVIDFSIENKAANVQSVKSFPKPAGSAQKKEDSEPPVKKVPPVRAPRLVEKQAETVKPKEPAPKPLQAEVSEPVPQKISPLQTKKRMVLEETHTVAANEPPTKSLPPQIPEQDVEPAPAAAGQSVSAESQSNPSSTRLTSSGPPAISPSPQDQYIKANFSYIRDIVQGKTRYPNMARRMGWEGRVLLAFVVCTDGRVEDIRVVKSCGYTALDKSAVNTVRRSAPFPKPPVRAEVTLPITYRLR